MRRLPYLAARLALAGFCWLTAMYAFVTSSAFAYQQFIKPRVFGWLGQFSDWHTILAWLWVALLAAVLWRDLGGDVRGDVRATGRTLASLLLAAAMLAAGWNTIRPVLPSLASGTGSVVAGVVALVPIAWLALVDHWRSPWLRTPPPALDARARAETEGRLLLAAVGAALLVAAIYIALASVRLARAFEPDLMGAGLARVVGIATGDLAFIFVGTFVALAVVGRLLGRWPTLHYGVLLAVAALGCAAAVSALLGSALGAGAGTAWAAGLALGTSTAGTWGGLRLRLAGADGSTADAVAVLLPAYEPVRGGRVVLGWAAIVPLAYVVGALSARMDWDFAVLKAGTLIVWIAAFAVVCRATPPRAFGSFATGALCSAPLLLHLLTTVTPATRHALDRYSVYNASFLVADTIVRPQPLAPSFDRYLRANTGLTDVSVAPIPIDLVAPPLAAAERTPLIFMLVIDSLRPDYLSPYNPAVHFTPRLEEFAKGNLRFANAFTRYGGTGLSMPAIWAGSALVHKQYVLPFASMNSLEKVLDRNGYQRAMSRDHITEALWQRRDSDRNLDRGRAEMDFDFCRTLEEIADVLKPGAAAPVPLFVQTRSLNLHVASVRNGYVPPGKVYDGFGPPYAWRVERMDACFGEFVDGLKRLGLYDHSLIVLTADHGELIGEDGRWGHSYHMFPEVVQIPLFMHLPASVQPGIVDVEGVSLSTDIVPTIYRVLGYQPVETDDLAGRSLVDTDDAQASARRDGSYVLAASYGAVYAVVRGNGRHLYIADAIKGVDAAYRRNADRRWAEIPVDAASRAAGQQHIRRYVDEVARRYGLRQRF